jgi:hypothetical protein
MKDLITYINEMSLEQLGKFIIDNIEGNTDKDKYKNAKDILKNNNSQNNFNVKVNDFLKYKFDVDKPDRTTKGLYNIINDYLSDDNKKIFVNILNPDNTKSFLSINDVFKGEDTICNDTENIFNIIIDKLDKNNETNEKLDKTNFKTFLTELSDTTLQGAQNAGRFEYLLKLFINGIISKDKNDVNIDIKDSDGNLNKLNIEVKFCRGCNFGPYKGKNPMSKEDINYLIDSINIIIGEKENISNNIVTNDNIGFGQSTIDNINNLLNYYNNDNSNIKIKDIIKNINYGDYFSENKVNKNNIRDYIAKYFIYNYVAHILKDHRDLKDLNNFLNNYFPENIVRDTNECLKNNFTKCIAIYFIHWYLKNKCKVENSKNNYLILFNNSLSPKKYGDYKWINASKYSDEEYKDPNKVISALIEFFDNNLYISNINKGNIEIKFQSK